ncbi:MAG TPA: metallophosphoesterase [Gemmatimonadaceae bacterium]|nr:metallophosphoesterase [Gemmatimonadaceae bacterium]
MRLGLIADTHDHLTATARLVERMAALEVEMILHAGDYCAPFSLRPFVEARLPLLGVFGRNDGDPEGLRAAAAAGVGIELYESPHSMEINGRRILLVHDIGDVHQRSLAGHNVVVHGCVHQVEMKDRGDTLLINPGEACGWVYGSSTAAVLDLDTRAVEILKLDAGGAQP